MRLGHLTDCYLPVLNGVTTFVRVCKRACEQAGVETHVFTSGHTTYPDSEAHVWRAPGLPLGKTGYYGYLGYPPAMLAQARQMDVLHVHHPFMAARQGALAATPMLPGKPCHPSVSGSLSVHALIVRLAPPQAVGRLGACARWRRSSMGYHLIDHWKQSANFSTRT